MKTDHVAEVALSKLLVTQLLSKCNFNPFSADCTNCTGSISSCGALLQTGHPSSQAHSMLFLSFKVTIGNCHFCAQHSSDVTYLGTLPIGTNAAAH